MVFVTNRKRLADMTLDELADEKAKVPENSMAVQSVNAEFMRRQAVSQDEMTQAAKDTATYTQQNARYMRWSVIVLAASSFITAVISVIQFVHPLH
jgi:hypothetical protein